MVAATCRGDPAEAERLARQAPTKVFGVPNYRGLAETMTHLALLHLIQSLETTALLWKTEGLQERNDLRACLHQVDAIYAYLLLVEAEAWERFCSEMHLEPDALIRDLPGFETVKKAEMAARRSACSAAEALQAVRERWGANASLPTVETGLADYRAALASREHCYT